MFKGSLGGVASIIRGVILRNCSITLAVAALTSDVFCGGVAGSSEQICQIFSCDISTKIDVQANQNQ